jgi:hypothetical protein
MVTRKDLVIAVLATFCLTATLFLIMPTRSSPQGYVPQLDTNHDGVINILDIAAVAKAYNPTNTGNDPTENVNVTNWPTTGINDYDVVELSANFTSNSETVPNAFFCGGYSRFSILLYPTTWDIGLNNNITIYIYGLFWFDNVGQRFESASFEKLNINAFNITVYSGGYNSPISYMIETKAPYCALLLSKVIPFGVNLPAHWWVDLDCAVYLRNE